MSNDPFLSPLPGHTANASTESQVSASSSSSSRARTQSLPQATSSENSGRMAPPHVTPPHSYYSGYYMGLPQWQFPWPPQTPSFPSPHHPAHLLPPPSPLMLPHPPQNLSSPHDVDWNAAAAQGSPVMRERLLSSDTGSPGVPLTGSRCPSCGVRRSSISASDASSPLSPLTMSDTGASDDISPGTTRRKRVDIMKKIVTEIQRDLRSTPTKLLLEILQAKDSSSSLYLNRCAFYRADNTPNFLAILDALYDDTDGKVLLRNWMTTRGIALVCEMVHKEMEAAKPLLRMVRNEVCSEYTDTWGPCSIMEPVAAITPMFSAVLEAATTPTSTSSLSSDKARHRTRCIISAQIHHLRSQMSAKFQIGMGLVASYVGASRSLIDMLHSAGLSIAYSTISSALGSLADSNMKKAREIAHKVHVLGYDNLQLILSTHVEQRPGAPSKVQSGTLPIIYSVPNASLDDVLLQPILDNLRKASPLTHGDLQMTDLAAESYRHQSRITVVNVLFQYAGLVSKADDSQAVAAMISNLKRDPKLHYRDRRRLPPGHKNEFYPLRVTPIEEASVDGNLHVHDDIYIHQLKMTPEELSKYAKPAINDQLTNSRIRGCQVLRRKDCNAWERREVFQLGFGVFHLLMNFIWGILQNHRGSVRHIGSLAYWFSLLGKVRLGSDRPDYHTLLTALTQIFHGLILNAWQEEVSDSGSLAEYLSIADADCLHAAADHIIAKYATISPSEINLPSSDEPKKKGKKNKQETPTTDTAYENTVLFIRDMLYAVEIAAAMKAGDFGRIEDILPDLACLFRGVGSNNYCMEVLHFLFSIKEVWTPTFSDIMRDMMLVNISGLDEHSMAMDLNEEHVVGNVKELFTAKASQSGWDRGANISCCVPQLKKLKKQAVQSMGASYSGTTHKSPDTTANVLLVAAKANEQGIQHRKAPTARPEDERPLPVADALLCGYEKIVSSTLAAFNKKVIVRKGERFIPPEPELEEDDIGAADFSNVVFETDEIE